MASPDSARSAEAEGDWSAVGISIAKFVEPTDEEEAWALEEKPTACDAEHGGSEVEGGWGLMQGPQGVSRHPRKEGTRGSKTRAHLFLGGC